MAINEELHMFVREALAHNVGRPELDGVLRRSGWSQSQVHDALARFADVEFPIPVPRPRPYLDARDAFLYLLLFVTLYISAFNLGSLMFLWIDRTWPNPATAGLTYRLEYMRSAMRFSTASLIVAAPVFLFVSRLTMREIRRDSAKRSSKVRRWLSYLTVFIASTVLIGDVIALVYNLLGGDLAIRFTLKILTIAVIAGAAFTFYLWDIRSDERDVRS